MFVISGTPDEFVQALYTVGRDFRVGEASTDGLGFNKSSGFKSTSEDDSDTSPG